MIINRWISTKLLDWKNRSNRKPLVLRGARQVGKTTIIKAFSKQFKHSIFINLEKPKDLRYFTTYDEVKLIIESLFITHNIDISELNNTLLFIDEIQESPKAIHLLRYFHEEYPELFVIAAGSLLEFAIKKVKSFPVGRVEYLYLHPLNFEEFLGAINHKIALKHLRSTPVNLSAHNILLELFNTYTILGGMPEVVKTYVETGSFTGLSRIYESIWSTYQNDVEKYTSNTTTRQVIKHIMGTAHLYIDDRIKFQNFGNSNYRSREVGEAFRNLEDAKIIQIIYPTTDIEVPIKPDLKKSPRLQFLDTGLVVHTLGIQAEMLGLNDLSRTFKGAIIPHIITQELLSLNSERYNKPHFWVREKTSSSEVDLVYAYKDKVVPIEIKSGTTGSLKSLHQFIEQSKHHYAIRVYGGEFKIEAAKTPNKVPYVLMNLPYYLGSRLKEYIAYFVENY